MTCRVFRTAVVLATWPFVYMVDRVRGVNPPSSLRRGLEWARDGEPAWRRD